MALWAWTLWSVELRCPGLRARADMQDTVPPRLMVVAVGPSDACSTVETARRWGSAYADLPGRLTLEPMLREARALRSVREASTTTRATLEAFLRALVDAYGFK